MVMSTPTEGDRMSGGELPAGTGGSAVASVAGVRSDKDDSYSLKVQAEYVLSARAASLTPLPNVTSVDPQSNRNNNNSNHSNHKKKDKSKYRKRARDKKIDDVDKMCLKVMQGEDCPRGDTCRFSHDIKAYLSSRPADIVEIEKQLGGCPHFQLYGHCMYGIMCRVGSSHLNLATGANLRRETVEGMSSPPPPPQPVMNILKKEVQNHLRKKSYPFQCQRYFESKKNPSGGDNSLQVQVDSAKVPSQTFTEAAAAASDAVEKTTIQQTQSDVMIVPSGINDVHHPTNKLVSTTDSLASVDKTKQAVVSTTVKIPDNNSIQQELHRTPSAPLDMTPLPTKCKKLIDFSNKVYVAPLTTVGNLPFRRIMKKYGADITCGEMAVASNLLEGNNSEWALLKRHPDEDIFGIQIAGGYPDMCTRVCELIEAETIVDFVDFNLGCPLDMICDKGCGAALMKREKQLRGALLGMTKVLSCCVTIKIRTGWDMNKPFAHELVPKIQSWGMTNDIAAIMIHGRSRLQRYSKEADWDYISQVATSQDPNMVQIPVIGNGDILSYTQHESNKQRPGVSSCAMLARGALIKPWLPREIKEQRHWDISASERLDILKDFVRFGLEHWGSDQQGVNNCRRFLLEWLSFLHRYVPVGMLEVLPQYMNYRPPNYLCGRNDLETLFLSSESADWIKISEMLLGPVPDSFTFEPKHKAKGY